MISGANRVLLTKSWTKVYCVYSVKMSEKIFFLSDF